MLIQGGPTATKTTIRCLDREQFDCLTRRRPQTRLACVILRSFDALRPELDHMAGGSSGLPISKLYQFSVRHDTVFTQFNKFSLNCPGYTRGGYLIFLSSNGPYRTWGWNIAKVS